MFTYVTSPGSDTFYDYLPEISFKPFLAELGGNFDGPSSTLSCQSMFSRAALRVVHKVDDDGAARQPWNPLTAPANQSTSTPVDC
jgi:hypothetical protein